MILSQGKIYQNAKGQKMVKKKMYQKIQTCKRQGLVKAEISRKLELDPRTVAKYYDMSEIDYREYIKTHNYRYKVFSRYREDVMEVYRLNGYKKLNVTAVYDYLEEKKGELPGNEKTLGNYIKYLFNMGQLKLDIKMRRYRKVPELPYGKQLQIDFGEYRVISGLKVYIFGAVLSASRYKYIAFQDKPFTTLDLIFHLLNCFDYIGGIPLELVIDQDSVMVVSENRGDIIYTKDFKYFIKEMGLQMYVCHKADPESKGKIENLIGYVKKNFLSVRDFKTVEEAQAGVEKWLKRRANGKISQATGLIPLDVIEEERKQLRMVRNSIYRRNSLKGREERRADDKAIISVGSSQYLLPSEYKNRSVEIYVTTMKIFVYDSYSGEKIIEHKVSLIPGSKILSRVHSRNTKRNTGEMKEEIREMFSEDFWKLFVRENFKKYHRYAKDQCIDAERYFRKDVNKEDLKKALTFCIEHKTYSMKELKDTYDYYRRIGDTHEEDILKKISPQLKAVARYKRDIKVSKRDIGVYKALVSIIMGVCA